MNAVLQEADAVAGYEGPRALLGGGRRLTYHRRLVLER
jgi:hypothetical protein